MSGRDLVSFGQAVFLKKFMLCIIACDLFRLGPPKKHFPIMTKEPNLTLGLVQVWGIHSIRWPREKRRKKRESENC